MFSVVKPIVVNPSDSRATNTTHVKGVTQRVLGSRPISTRVALCNSFTAAKGKRNASGTLITNLVNCTPSDNAVHSTVAATRRQKLSISFRTSSLSVKRPGITRVGVGKGDKEVTAIMKQSLNNNHIVVARVSKFPIRVANRRCALLAGRGSIPNVITSMKGVLTRRRIGVSGVHMFHGKGKARTMVVVRSSRGIPRSIVYEVGRKGGGVGDIVALSVVWNEML